MQTPMLSGVGREAHMKGGINIFLTGRYCVICITEIKGMLGCKAIDMHCFVYNPCVSFTTWYMSVIKSLSDIPILNYILTPKWTRFALQFWREPYKSNTYDIHFHSYNSNPGERSKDCQNFRELTWNRYTVFVALQQYHDGRSITAVSKTPVYYVFSIQLSDNILIKTKLKCKSYFFILYYYSVV